MDSGLGKEVWLSLTLDGIEVDLWREGGWINAHRGLQTGGYQCTCRGELKWMTQNAIISCSVLMMTAIVTRPEEQNPILLRMWRTQEKRNKTSNCHASNISLLFVNPLKIDWTSSQHPRPTTSHVQTNTIALTVLKNDDVYSSGWWLS